MCHRNSERPVKDRETMSSTRKMRPLANTLYRVSFLKFFLAGVRALNVHAGLSFFQI